MDGGSLQVAIWERPYTVQNKEKTAYSVTIELSYYDQNEKQWKNTEFIRGGAVPALSAALLQAFSFITAQLAGDPEVPF